VVNSTELLLAGFDMTCKGALLKFVMRRSKRLSAANQARDKASEDAFDKKRRWVLESSIENKALAACCR